MISQHIRERSRAAPNYVQLDTAVPTVGPTPQASSRQILAGRVPKNNLEVTSSFQRSITVPAKGLEEYGRSLSKEMPGIEQKVQNNLFPNASGSGKTKQYYKPGTVSDFFESQLNKLNPHEHRQKPEFSLAPVPKISQYLKNLGHGVTASNCKGKINCAVKLK